MDAQKTRLVKTLLADDRFQGALKSCKNMDDAHETAKLFGINLSKNDFIQTMKEAEGEFRKLRELNDEDLLNTVQNPDANRMSDGEIAATVIGSVGAVTGAVGAGAAVLTTGATIAAAIAGGASASAAAL